jgi:hypothetical protein
MLCYLVGMLLFALSIRQIEEQPAWAWGAAFFGCLIVFPWLFQRCLLPRAQRQRQQRLCKCPCSAGSTLMANALVIVARGCCGHRGEVILTEAAPEPR